jgi:NitT/TauT family transport system permease protein
MEAGPVSAGQKAGAVSASDGASSPGAGSPLDFGTVGRSGPGRRSLWEIGVILGIAVVVFWGVQLILQVSNTPPYVFPHPVDVVTSLFSNFGALYAHNLLMTVEELIIGVLIGSTIGLVLAAVVTEYPFVEKVVTPYILLMVTTPMVALVPFLMLKFGFGLTPRVIAVALASGPMVMINASTGFRRTDRAKIALARAYGASTFQIFAKVRFPMALPMIIVGYMVGSIFGLLTAVAAEMVGGNQGLGNRLVYFASLNQMASFGAVLILIAALGIVIYALFALIAKRWTSWEA